MPTDAGVVGLICGLLVISTVPVDDLDLDVYLSYRFHMKFALSCILILVSTMLAIGWTPHVHALCLIPALLSMIKFVPVRWRPGRPGPNLPPTTDHRPPTTDHRPPTTISTRFDRQLANSPAP